MVRPTKSPWKRIFSDLDRGDSQEKVCERYGVSPGTLRNKLSKRKSSPSSGDNVVTLPRRPASHAQRPPPRTRDREAERKRKLEEVEARRAQEKARNVLAVAKASGIDKEVLQQNISLTNERLNMALTMANSKAAKEFAQTLTLLTDKLNVILAAEEQFKEPTEEADLSTPEGQRAYMEKFDGNPKLVSLIEIKTLRAALQAAEERQRRQA